VEGIKWYWYVIAILIILVGIEEYRISHFRLTIEKKNNIIKELQNTKPQEVIPGKPDTVIIEKPKIVKVSVPFTRDIDTLINKDDHLIRLKTKDEFISIDIECRAVELIIKQPYTIKVYVPELKEVEVVKHELKPETFLVGFGTGAVATVLIVYGIKQITK